MPSERIWGGPHHRHHSSSLGRTRPEAARYLGVTAVAPRYGKARAGKWLEGIRANASGHIYPDNEALVAQVNSGQVLLGVINNYYWYRLATSSAPVEGPLGRSASSRPATRAT